MRISDWSSDVCSSDLHADGTPIRSCVTPLAAVAGKQITTIEGVGADRVGQAVQAAWRKLDVAQCGSCQSGQIMSATALLAQNRQPSDADIDSAIGGHVCRCAPYARLRPRAEERRVGQECVLTCRTRRSPAT